MNTKTKMLTFVEATEQEMNDLQSAHATLYDLKSFYHKFDEERAIIIEETMSILQEIIQGKPIANEEIIEHDTVKWYFCATSDNWKLYKNGKLYYYFDQDDRGFPRVKTYDIKQFKYPTVQEISDLVRNASSTICRVKGIEFDDDENEEIIGMEDAMFSAICSLYDIH